MTNNWGDAISSLVSTGISAYGALRARKAAKKSGRALAAAESGMDSNRGPGIAPGGVVAPPSASPASKTALVVGGLVVGSVLLVLGLSFFKGSKG